MAFFCLLGNSSECEGCGECRASRHSSMVCTACDEPIDEGERFYDFGGEQYHMDDDCVDVYLARYQDVATLE